MGPLMYCDIYLTIEKQTPYGWSLATTPQPSAFWSGRLPPGEIDNVIAKAQNYLALPAPVMDASAPNHLYRVLRFFLDHFSPDEAALLFGEEPWFKWTPGTPAYLEVRNYALFAVLANVNNSYNIVPIAQPRGLPPDCCPETSDYHGWFGNSCHSASHVTLAELMAYPQNSFINVHTQSYHVRDAAKIDDIATLLSNFGTPDHVRVVFWFVDGSSID